ncbi:GH15193 [Drosophila grimshawi]|uniref:GH15193 n=2 Tax=Drosophila grimshawi TaxID=7222 RepID=B4IXS9_DROGR|nr:GH15193 [Drosophila grimshawi]
MVLIPATLALVAEPRHEACVNEERYENQVMCAGVQFGYRAPYPDNCTLYLVCDCIYPTVMQCSANLYWDNSTQNCNWPQDVECIYYTIDTTTTILTVSPTQTTPKTTSPMSSTTETPLPTSSYDPPPPPPGIEMTYCKNFADGSVHRYPYDCNAYINCTHGWPVLNYCEPDKVFNQVLSICDTPETAQCEPLPLPPTTTTAEPTTTTITTELTTTTAEPTTTTTITTTTEDGQCGDPPLGIEEDYCEPLGNGFYTYPYNCNAYISCRNGCTGMAYCIPDKLFNPWLHICDTPNSVQCNPEPYPTSTVATTESDTSSSSGGAETITTPVTTESNWSTTTVVTTTTTPALPADVDPDACKGLPDYTRLPYAGDCAQFLQCKDNQVVMNQCPKPLLFNPDYLICDEPNDVVCYGDRTTSTSTIPPTTTTEEPTTTTSSTTLTTMPATTLGPAELCKDKELGDSFPYVEDCSKYILCLGDGNFYVAMCMVNSYYDPKTGMCGPNVSPTACKETAVATTTTTEATTAERTTTTEAVSTTTSVAPTQTTTTSTPVQPGGICGNKDEGEMIAYPNDCSKYIVCVSPIPVAFYCRPDSYFNAKQQQCVQWEDSDCDKEASSTTTPGYTPAPLEPTMCTNSSRGTFPYPENCQWFIRCVNDYIYMMDVCNCGEYYDPISGECGADVPSDACRWDYTSTTTVATTLAPVTRPPPQKGPCDDVADGELVPYPNDCSKYIKCDRPIAAAFDCDAGDEFSPVLRKCMEASLANCPGGATTGPGETTTKGPTPSTTEEPSTTVDTSTTQGISTTPETSTTEETSTTQGISTTPETSTTEETSTTQGISTTPETSTTVDTSTTQGISTTPETSTTEETSTTQLTTTTEETSTSETTTTTESTTTEATTTEITTTPAPSGICGGKPNGTLVPYPNNCGKYIVCLEPIPIGYDCAEGLEFSPTELECMDPDLANCAPKPTPKPTPIPTTTTESSTITTPVSTTVPADTTPSTTPETTTISTDSTSTTLETSPITTTPAPTTMHPDTPNICCGYPLGTILPYPNDCNRYVVCDYPIPYAVACGEGEVFDVEYLQCTDKASCIQ